MFCAVQVAVIYGVDDPPGVKVIDEMFGRAVVVNEVLAEALLEEEFVTVTVML